MSLVVWLGAVAGALVGPSTGPVDAVKSDAAKLVGTWQLVWAEQNGSRAPEAWMEKRVLVLTADGHFIMRTGEPEDNEGDFVLDTYRLPDAIDLRTYKGPFRGKTVFAIYEHTGGELTVCFPVLGTDRPTEFTSGPGSMHVLMKYRRVKFW
jgi:uncharacterized protein (TIGR03067 family)